MAAIDLSDDVTRPTLYTEAGVGTTWQEYALPAWATKVTVYGSAALYVAVDTTGGAGGETPADGGAVGTHRLSIAATTLTQFFFRPEDYFGAKKSSALTIASSIFVAAQSGTATVDVWVE